MSALTLVTGANHSHFLSLVQFLCNLARLRKRGEDLAVVCWDLGLSVSQFAFVRDNFPGVILKTLDYVSLPPWADIQVNAGQYAWKPAVILRTLPIADEFNSRVLVWMDSGNLITQSSDPLVQAVKQVKVYSPTSSGTVRQWTHPGMLAHLSAMDWPFIETVLDAAPRNGACLGFDLDSELARGLLDRFCALSLQRECIAPLGSNRSNHRQDQALFSLLYYQLKHTHPIPSYPAYCGFSIHNDID